MRRSRGPEVDVVYSVIAHESAYDNDGSQLHVVYDESAELARSYRFSDIPDQVERALSIRLAEFARSRVFIHAGVVSWNGSAILVPGPSHSGKSSLVAALLRAGLEATYYSDEFAVVDRCGYVHPYPCPLSLRNGDGVPHRTPAADLPAKVGNRRLRVGLVLITEFREAATWRPRRLTPGQGLLAVLANTTSARRRPARALKALATLLEGATILKGPRGDADETAAALIRGGYLRRFSP
jgi:hypothetical protein